MANPGNDKVGGASILEVSPYSWNYPWSIETVNWSPLTNQSCRYFKNTVFNI